jgi:hypothetical protein
MPYTSNGVASGIIESMTDREVIEGVHFKRAPLADIN